MPPTRINPGDTFDRLTVIGAAGTDAADGSRLFLCQCVCGGTCTPRANALTSGKTRSCGCLRQDAARHMHLYRRRKRRLRTISSTVIDEDWDS